MAPGHGESDSTSVRQGRDAARRARRDRAAFAAWLTLGFGLGGLSVGILSSDFFRIQTVSIVCPEASISQEAVTQARTLRYGTIWVPPTRATERTIGALPRVKEVTLDRHLPRTLVIAVKPRQPAAALECDDRYMLMDEEGVCLNWTGKPMEHLPKARMAALPGLGVGGRIPAAQSEPLRQVLSGLHQAKLSPGAQIDLAHPQRISVRTGDGVLAKLGDAQHLEEKVVLFGKLLEALRAKGHKPLYIDMRVPSHPTYGPAH